MECAVTGQQLVSMHYLMLTPPEGDKVGYALAYTPQKGEHPAAATVPAPLEAVAADIAARGGGILRWNPPTGAEMPEGSGNRVAAVQRELWRVDCGPDVEVTDDDETVVTLVGAGEVAARLRQGGTLRLESTQTVETPTGPHSLRVEFSVIVPAPLA